MSTGEEMMREQLDRIIARAELRIEQHWSHASALAPYGNQAKRARGPTRTDLNRSGETEDISE